MNENIHINLNTFIQANKKNQKCLCWVNQVQGKSCCCDKKKYGFLTLPRCLDLHPFGIQKCYGKMPCFVDF